MSRYANRHEFFASVDEVVQRLLEEIVTPDVFAAAHTLRHRNAFTRDAQCRAIA